MPSDLTASVDTNVPLHTLDPRDAGKQAAAQQLGCRLLLTEDLQHRLQVDQLHIVNPFLAGPELLDAPTA